MLGEPLHDEAAGRLEARQLGGGAVQRPGRRDDAAKHFVHVKSRFRPRPDASMHGSGEQSKRRERVMAPCEPARSVRCDEDSPCMMRAQQGERRASLDRSPGSTSPSRRECRIEGGQRVVQATRGKARLISFLRPRFEFIVSLLLSDSFVPARSLSTQCVDLRALRELCTLCCLSCVSDLFCLCQCLALPTSYKLKHTAWGRGGENFVVKFFVS